MSNWSQAEKFLKEYENGDTFGSSMKENARYIDSVQGKLTLLQEKWRSIINTAVSGNTAKQFLDIGITVLDIIDKIIKKLDDAGVALPVIAGAISGLFQSLKLFVTHLTS